MVYQTPTEPVQKDTWHDVLVAFGSNQSLRGQSPFDLVSSAIKELINKGFQVVSESRLYSTPAFPANSGPQFANAVVHYRVPGSPQDVHEITLEVEKAFERRRENRWGQRTLDVDILAFDHVVLPDEATFRYWQELSLDDQRNSAPSNLILPHPRIQDRAFVLVPLLDVAPDWVHPVSGKTTRQMLSELSPEEVASVVPVEA